MASYDNKVLTGDKLTYYSGLIKTALAGKQDSLVFNTAYNASSNKVATMSDLSGKQDALVFNTAYNASSNKVATMADIPASTTIVFANNDYDASDNPAITVNDLTTYNDSIMMSLNSLTVSDIKYDEEEDGEGIITPIMLSSKLSDMDTAIAGKQGALVFNTTYNASSNKVATMSDIPDISGKQDTLVFNTAYNASSNKVATMSDITTALSGIGSFSFEIVLALPQSNISTSKIYLVAKSTSGTNQVYTEYAYVNNAWEIIGDTEMTIDTLSNSEVATIWSAASAS